MTTPETPQPSWHPGTTPPAPQDPSFQAAPGATPPAPYGAPNAQFTPPPPPARNGLAIAGFVVALFAILGSFIPVINFGSILLAVIGLILAGIGLAKARTSGSGKGLAITGLILGVLTIIIAIAANVGAAKVIDNALDDVTGSSVAPPSSGDNSDAEGDSDAGSSRTNPAPIGSTITGGDWAVTINSVTTTETDMYDSSAADGSVLLVVNLTAKYTGDDEQGSTPWAQVKFVTADGTTISSTDGSTMFVAEDEFDILSKVYEGGSVTGDQIIEVPADTWKDGVLAVSPELMSDDVFVAVS